MSFLNKLSFTKSKNFEVDWKSKLNEVLEENLLTSMSVDSEKLFDENFYETYNQLLKDDKKNVNHFKRLLYFSSSLEIYFIEIQNSSNISRSNLLPLKRSSLGSLDEKLYAPSEIYLFNHLESVMTENENGYLKMNCESPYYQSILGLIFENLIHIQKIMGFSQNNSEALSFLQIDNEPLKFRLRIDRDSSFCKIWGEYYSKNEFVYDLWQFKNIFHSSALTNEDEFFQIEHSHQHTSKLAHYMLSKGPLSVPDTELGLFFKELFNQFGVISYRLDPSITLEKVMLTPEPILYLKTATMNRDSLNRIEGQIWFRYHKIEIPALFHRQENRLRILSFEQFIREKSIHIKLFLPNESAEEVSMQNMRSTDGIRIDHKKNVFKLDFIKLHQIISYILSHYVSQSGVVWEIWAENLKVKLLNNFQMKIKYEDSILSFEFKDPNSKKRFESWQIIHILKKKSAFIILDDGTLGVLPQAWVDELYHLFKYNHDETEFTKSSFYNFYNLENEGPFGVEGDDFYKAARTRFEEKLSHNSLIPLTPSPHFCGELYDFQKHGLGWLVFLEEFGLNGLLADDMGLGKSIQVLAFLDFLKWQMSLNSRSNLSPNSNSICSTLLVAPKSVLSQWLDLAQQFCPALKIKILSPREIKIKLQENNFNLDHDIYVTSYGLIRRYAKELNQFAFDRIILDEAQIIKNETSQVSMAVKILKCRKRLALSGTPIENHLSDFFSLFSFLNPGLVPIHLLFSENQEKVKSVFDRLRPLILHRKKEDVLLNLPNKIEETISLDLFKEQKEIYDQVKNVYSQKIKSMEDQNQFLSHKYFFLEGLLRLRQLCCHPQLIYSEGDLDQPLNSAKMDYLLNKLNFLNNSENFATQSVSDEAGVNKILVFSQFTSFLKLIKIKIEEMGMPYCYLDGQTQNRKQIVDEFQTRPEIKIFLIGLKAGGLGINLTAANHCILLDPWWNPAVEMQAIDRLNRIGQKRDIFITRLIAKDTIEEKMQLLQKTKSERAQILTSSNNDFLNSLTLQDFKDLFS